jgi:branched-subunit amino acid ABC-type transport system permease component
MFFLVDPFFYEIVISGLLAGVMYALVALGFVLIFKRLVYLTLRKVF